MNAHRMSYQYTNARFREFIGKYLCGIFKKTDEKHRDRVFIVKAYKKHAELGLGWRWTKDGSGY